MQRETVGEVAGRRIIVMDSISYIGADEEGEIAALKLLEDASIVAVTVTHTSARIGASADI